MKDLKPEDLRYLLGKLPPWISSPEWEAGKPAQELLGLLWPALNSTICLALKNVIEDRLQGSAEYGHINFSRFSLGRSPPQICGIKAVPLHEEDVLAMVVDLDVRWGGRAGCCAPFEQGQAGDDRPEESADIDHGAFGVHANH